MCMINDDVIFHLNDISLLQNLQIFLHVSAFTFLPDGQ